MFINKGIQVCLFSIEWNARKTSEICPKIFESEVLDYLVPRSLICMYN